MARSVHALRARVLLRTRIKRTLGQPIWAQNARNARASTDRVGLRDVDSATRRIIAQTPYTKTPPVRVVALCNAVDYVVAHGIPGEMVECGLWRGGSLMAVALKLRDLGVADRRLYGFDTFAGMTAPTDHDGNH